ncbi:MAG TPA: caspase family protein, partial [Terriglobales bacterium]|nr:caspase family protein [Terriglobales bacterium]
RPPAKAPELYAIVAGITEYASPTLRLRFAASDAEDIAKALELGARRLFGADRVHLTLLASSDDPRALPPTKANFLHAFEEARRAHPEDVFLLYLAGHGTTLARGSDLYLYLTADARGFDLSDPELRRASSISSEELVQWVKQVPALKQVMILDTCGAGGAAAKLVEKRDVPGDQVRAIDRLKDRTGFHVLMGSAADAVSYEATRYGQGLLTYALLQGMRGAALREDEYVDVSRLFQYAADKVPELAADLGGIQRPLVAAPGGTSFDVGLLTSEDKREIPLAAVHAMVLRPSLIDRDQGFDDLNLTSLLRQALRDRARVEARGPAQAVYVDEEELPGALRPTGTYAVEGDQVTVNLVLRREGATVARREIQGQRGDLPGLVQHLLDAISDAAKP